MRRLGFDDFIEFSMASKAVGRDAGFPGFHAVDELS